jgi:hypothetical protein
MGRRQMATLSLRFNLVVLYVSADDLVGASEGSCCEDQGQLARPNGCSSIGRPAAGCWPGRVPLRQGAAISRSGTVSPTGDQRASRAPGTITDDIDTIINASGANGWRAVRRASVDAVRAVSTATSPERGRAFRTPGSRHSAGADGGRTASEDSTGAVRTARVTSGVTGHLTADQANRLVMPQ